MGVENAEMDEFGAVYASIPSNSGEGIPAIGFTAIWILRRIFRAAIFIQES